MRHKPRLKRGVIKTWERPVRTCTPMRMPARGALDAGGKAQATVM